MLSNALRITELFIFNPWTLLGIGVAIAAYGLMNPNSPFWLFYLAAFLATVGVYRACESLQQSTTASLLWAIFCASSLSLIFYYTHWSNNPSPTETSYHPPRLTPKPLPPAQVTIGTLNQVGETNVGVNTGSIIINPKPEDTGFKLKDKIVAERLGGVISYGTLTIQSLMPQGSSKVIYEIHPDLTGTNYPDPKLLDGLVEVLLRTNLMDRSNATRNGKPLTWVGSFSNDFMAVSQQCDGILAQFSHQSGELITQVEDLSRASKNMLGYFQTIGSAPSIGPDFYKHGLPNQYAELFRQYFLILMKTHRIIQKYGVHD
jgi:hypothetical protein